MELKCSFIKPVCSIQCASLNATHIEAFGLQPLQSTSSLIVSGKRLVNKFQSSTLSFNTSPELEHNLMFAVLPVDVEIDLTKPIQVVWNTSVSQLDVDSSYSTQHTITIEEVNTRTQYFNTCEGKFFTSEGYRIIVWL